MSGSVALFVHAAPVSLSATEAALARLPAQLPVRHALAFGLVDPAATHFDFDDAAYQRLQKALAEHLRGDESRIVLSCSVYNGFATRLQADLAIPVERSDDAGIEAALGCGSRIGLAVSYPPSYGVIESHLVAVAAQRQRVCEPVPLLSENAFAYADDPERYAAALVTAARAARALDAIFLAQFSMDPFAAAVAAETGLPVVSALEACVSRLGSQAGRPGI